MKDVLDVINADLNNKRYKLWKWTKQKGLECKRCECCGVGPVIEELYVDAVGRISLKGFEGYRPIVMRKLCPVCWSNSELLLEERSKNKRNKRRIFEST